MHSTMAMGRMQNKGLWLGSLEGSTVQIFSLMGFRYLILALLSSTYRKTFNSAYIIGIRNMRHAAKLSELEGPTQTCIKMAIRLRNTAAYNACAENRARACLWAQRFDTPP